MSRTPANNTMVIKRLWVGCWCVYRNGVLLAAGRTRTAAIDRAIALRGGQ